MSGCAKPRILSLCDKTGNMVRPWADAGYECLCVDLQHDGERQEDFINFISADIRFWMPPPGYYDFVFAFPPCTNLSVSGARWFLQKGVGGLMRALEVFEACRRICEWSGAPWMIENPVSTISSYWRKPDFTFHPFQYGAYLHPPGDAYTKKTCLWTSDDFVMPDLKPVEPVEGSKMHLLPPSDRRGDLRSVTPPGFARAVFMANARSVAQ